MDSGRSEQNTPTILFQKIKLNLKMESMFQTFFKNKKRKIKNQPANTEDGLKIEFDNDWVHLRTSNTEPIIRIYAESNFETTANNIALRLIQDIREAANSKL